MSRVKDADIQEVRQRTDIVDLVREHVDLRRAGTSWKGLCPFHDERSPSFSVTPATATVHCFGCGAGGDAIWFIQEIGGYRFREAVEFLAERINYELTLDESEDNADADRAARARLYEINDAAAAYFGEALLTEEAKPGQALLTSRGFDVAGAVAQFGCGYAPNGGLVKYLRDRRFTIDEMIAAGLATMTDRSVARERFRNRLVWTIRDSFGKAIGFGARRLLDNDPIAAKFLNTSETPVYKKSLVLYGFAEARREIARLRQVIVVEGYTDVMAFRLAGVLNVVASCGTAFTADHMNALARIVGDSGEVVFAFDDDNAGRKASLAVYDLARNSPVRRLSALPASQGLDPDELRQKDGDQALRSLLDGRRPLIETVILGTIAAMPTDTPEDRVVALEAVLPVVEHAEEPLRSEYARMATRRLRFPFEHVSSRLRDSAAPASATPPRIEVVRAAGWAEKEMLQSLCQSRAAAAALLAQAKPLLMRDASLRVAAVLDAALSNGLGGPWPLHVLDTAPEADRPLITWLLGSDLDCVPARVTEHASEALSRLREEHGRRRRDELAVMLETATSPEEKRATLAAALAFQADSESASA